MLRRRRPAPPTTPHLRSDTSSLDQSRLRSAQSPLNYGLLLAYVSIAGLFTLFTIYRYATTPIFPPHIPPLPPGLWHSIPYLSPRSPARLRLAAPPLRPQAPSSATDHRLGNHEPEICAKRVANGEKREELDGACEYAKWVYTDDPKDAQPPFVDCPPHPQMPIASEQMGPA